jgi:hypothetical protein|tara:strand:- start:5606 stop:5821 length:216 start_codon:yes stop_codon:yes gene_type:complete
MLTVGALTEGAYDVDTEPGVGGGASGASREKVGKWRDWRGACAGACIGARGTKFGGSGAAKLVSKRRTTRG